MIINQWIYNRSLGINRSRKKEMIIASKEFNDLQTERKRKLKRINKKSLLKITKRVRRN